MVLGAFHNSSVYGPSWQLDPEMTHGPAASRGFRGSGPKFFWESDYTTWHLVPSPWGLGFRARPAISGGFTG